MGAAEPRPAPLRPGGRAPGPGPGDRPQAAGRDRCSTGPTTPRIASTPRRCRGVSPGCSRPTRPGRSASWRGPAGARARTGSGSRTAGAWPSSCCTTPSSRTRSPWPRRYRPSSRRVGFEVRLKQVDDITAAFRSKDYDAGIRYNGMQQAGNPARAQHLLPHGQLPQRGRLGLARARPADPAAQRGVRRRPAQRSAQAGAGALPAGGADHLHRRPPVVGGPQRRLRRLRADRTTSTTTSCARTSPRGRGRAGPAGRYGDAPRPGPPGAGPAGPVRDVPPGVGACCP